MKKFRTRSHKSFKKYLLTGSLVTVACTLFVPLVVLACAIAPEHPGDKIELQSEETLLIWQPQTQTEHFIRKAVFNTQSERMGFIVPTPSVPEVAPVSASLFSKLDQWIAPQKKEIVNYQLSSLLFQKNNDETKSARPPDNQVAVLQRNTVAGYEIATLASKDAGALELWLKKNHFSSFKGFESWAQPYLHKSWVFTAFKLQKKDKVDTGLELPLVRMSFKTAHPFYPFREPKMNVVPPYRNLRLYLVGPGPARVDSKNKSDLAESTLLYRKALNLQQTRQIQTEALKSERIAPDAWLTAFDYLHSERKDIDPIFQFLPVDQRQDLPTFKREVITLKTSDIPIELLLFFLAILVIILRIIVSLFKSPLRKSRLGEKK